MTTLEATAATIVAMMPPETREAAKITVAILLRNLQQEVAQDCAEQAEACDAGKRSGEVIRERFGLRKRTW